MTRTLADSVSISAMILDRIMPKLGYSNWARAIRLGTFDITSPSRCILGQLFDDGNGKDGFDTAKHQLNVYYRGTARTQSPVFSTWNVLERYGFVPGVREVAEVQRAWIVEIKNRVG